ncbi:amidohydrolase [Thermosipho melanesiensis]|uniref:Amidohydrolase n=2 Tax=Thermosipho melanesiensis TaxID=46541 RepID=A6LKB6_THEM4|nr:amidohydrolase [Thermosipho melanesiensis]ABR30367.1 amidohydrolase [Thermosipho melanesiensis BI429]APT73532.1 amidohydrolase [Thermosipho melanesiensis]OOC37482.1 amidohydrolase [Thermosipho melanesiensis]OOC39621.1 amidohydrolase [Thermosipho melanesiensis]OOC39639.1 amidohydrolase [Thermosipho melanesiensis]
MVLLKNGTIYPITNKPFKGDILIDGGIIKEIGENIEVKDAEVIDVSGRYIFPGFIDAHSHIGVFEEGVGEFYYQDGNEYSEPLTPHVRALDAFYPGDSAIRRALSGGVTTAMVVPGSANPIGGQGFILKFKSDIVDEMVIRQPAGLKMAFGENPKRVYGSKGKMPTTRLGVAAVIREYFTRVKDYMKKREEDPKTPIDFKLEIGVKVLKREIPARCHAHRADDIVTAIRIAEEFNFDIVIEHATEGYKIANFLKQKKIPVVLGPLFGFRTKLELIDMTYEAIKIINEHGILAALMCDHPVIHLEHANIQAATALRYGAKEEDLLKMLTINPAKILKIDNRVGSLEKGKDADIVVWNTHPFDFRAKAEMVFIEGKVVYRE